MYIYINITYYFYFIINKKKTTGYLFYIFIIYFVKTVTIFLWIVLTIILTKYDLINPSIKLKLIFIILIYLFINISY